jgi:two-component system alkaline phosphatase synthesis response regulator PhoP
MIHIAVVEDEESLSEMIRLNLELEGYEVTLFTNGQEANNSFEQSLVYDLLILDVMLPGMDGIQICKNVRKHSIVPILFLSAKGTTNDRIEGLKSGGNDYLPKPFDLEELLLRIAILTKNTNNEEVETRIGDFKVNFKTYTITNLANNQDQLLTKKEIDLIVLFCQKEGEVISRSEILDKVWGRDQFPTTRTIDNYILQLRKTFEDNPKEPKYFHSIRGVGYKFTK